MSDYAKLTVVKLKEELKRRTLPQTGLKAALVARLEENDAAQSGAGAVASQDQEKPDEGPAAAEVKAPEGEEKPVAQEEPVEEEDEATKEPPGRSSPRTEATGPTLGDAPLENAGGEVKEIQQDAKVKKAEEMLADEAKMPEIKADDVVAEATKTESSPRPAVQATGDDATPTPSSTRNTSIPIPSAESEAEPPSQIARATEHTQVSTQTSVAPEEQFEDSRKRKRRSHSPALLTQDVAMKKLKGEDGSSKAATPEGVVAVRPTQDEGMKDSPIIESSSSAPPARPSAGDARFKALFAQGPNAASTDTQTTRPALDRDVAPAVHPATTALYIRNFMRPMQPGALREHLSALAEPDSSNSDDGILAEFHMDSIKTHCLVQFKSITAASRVRTALHDTVWPDEKSRKPLWADFVPEEKLKTWINVELDAAGSRPPKRWEVVYEDEEGTIMAYLQEADSAPRRMNTLTSQNGIPSAPASAKAPPAPTGDVGQGFQALDDLFKSTVAKPKLYFQPVADGVARKRLDRLAAGRGGGRSDEMRRFTFEDDGVLVDNGPEFRPGYRGGSVRGRGGGFRRRGGFRGDSWRGGR